MTFYRGDGKILVIESFTLSSRQCQALRDCGIMHFQCIMQGFENPEF